MRMNIESYYKPLLLFAVICLVFIYVDANILPTVNTEEFVVEKWYKEHVSLKSHRNRTTYYFRTDQNFYTISEDTYNSFRLNDTVLVIHSCIAQSFLGLILLNKSILIKEGIYSNGNGGTNLLIINAALLLSVLVFRKWLKVKGGKERLYILFSLLAIAQLMIYIFR